MSIRIVCAFALLALLAASAPAEAGRHRLRPRHRSHARVALVMPWGLYLGGGLVATRVLHQQGGEELLGDGAGLTLYAGLRVHPALALETGWVGTVHDPRGATFAGDEYLILNGFTVDARVYVPGAEGERPIEPYLQGGLGVYLLDNSYIGAQSTGTGFQLGGGLDAALGPHLELGLRGLYRGLAMGPVESSYTDTYVGALTAELDLTLRF